MTEPGYRGEMPRQGYVFYPRGHEGTNMVTDGAEGNDPTRLTRWLNHARQGDQDAFNQLFAASAPRLLTFIAISLPRHLRAKVDPEDVLQEVMVRAWKDIAALRQEDTQAFHRWLAGIARHRITDAIRWYGKKRRAVELEEGFHTSPDSSVYKLEHTPSKSAARREQLDKIVGILDMLKESYRDVPVYGILQGYTTKEVAGRLGMTENNVNVTRHRALKKLSELLTEHGVETTIFRPL